MINTTFSGCLISVGCPECGETLRVQTNSNADRDKTIMECLNGKCGLYQVRFFAPIISLIEVEE